MKIEDIDQMIEYIRKLMKVAGMTQTDLAEAIGFSQSQISTAMNVDKMRSELEEMQSWLEGHLGQEYGKAFVRRLKC